MLCFRYDFRPVCSSIFRVGKWLYACSVVCLLVLKIYLPDGFLAGASGCEFLVLGISPALAFVVKVSCI